jgi:hypothetical protein
MEFASMTIKIGHSKATQYVPPESVYTGLQPTTVTAEGARSVFENSVNWSQWGQLANYYGRPDPTKNGNYDSTFQLILPVNHSKDQTSITRKIGIECQCWDYTDAGADTIFKYDGTTQETWTRTASQTQDYDEDPAGLNYSGVHEYDQDDETDGYGVHTFAVDGSLVARLGVYSLPEYNLNTDAAYRLNSGNFGSGQPLKGDFNNSIGTLAQFQNSTSADIAETMVSNSRKCLAQWVTPAGVYCAGAGGSLAWVDMFDDFTFKIRPRNLRVRTYGSDVSTVDLAVVTRHNDTTGLRITSTETSDTAGFTFSGDATTPTLSVLRDAIDIDPEGDEITVEVNTSTTLGVEVHSIAIFESQSGILI